MRKEVERRMNLKSTTGTGAAFAAGTVSFVELTARLYDYAAIPTRTLSEAERVSSEIFHEAGVDLRWVECAGFEENSQRFNPCGLVKDPLGISLKIVPDVMTTRYHRPTTELGMALQTDAAVFFDHIQKFSAINNVSVALLLGHSMAHEVGHMLLRQKDHSPTGIMTRTWGKAHCSALKKSRLIFTREQAEMMQSRLRDRSSAEK
jgi:hypothetical protein